VREGQRPGAEHRREGLGTRGESGLSTPESKAPDAFGAGAARGRCRASHTPATLRGSGCLGAEHDASHPPNKRVHSDADESRAEEFEVNVSLNDKRRRLHQSWDFLLERQVVSHWWCEDYVGQDAHEHEKDLTRVLSAEGPNALSIQSLAAGRRCMRLCLSWWFGGERCFRQDPGAEREGRRAGGRGDSPVSMVNVWQPCLLHAWSDKASETWWRVTSAQELLSKVSTALARAPCRQP